MRGRACLLRVLAFAVFAVLVVAPVSAEAQQTPPPPPVQLNRLTPSYNVGLHITAPLTLVAGQPGERPTSNDTEIAPVGPGGAAPTLPPEVDAEGHAVNRHVDVTVFVISTGQVFMDGAPGVTFTNQANGQKITLTMLPLQGLLSGRHFGTNAYLPDGAYTVTVDISGEQATFPAVALTSGAAIPGASPLPARTPTELTRTGSDPGPPLWPFLAGGVLIVVGVLWRQRADQRGSRDAARDQAPPPART